MCTRVPEISEDPEPEKLTFREVSERLSHLKEVDLSSLALQINPRDIDPDRWHKIFAALNGRLEGDPSIFLPYILTFSLVLIHMGADPERAVCLAISCYAEDKACPRIPAADRKLANIILSFLIYGTDMRTNACIVILPEPSAS